MQRQDRVKTEAVTGIILPRYLGESQCFSIDPEHQWVLATRAVAHGMEIWSSDPGLCVLRESLTADEK